MTVTHMDFSTRFGAHRPNLFKKRTRDALADLIAQRFPFGRRAAVRKAFSLTDDQARAACRGSPSWETFDQVLDEGGWAVALELLAIRFGEGVDQHLAREKHRHEQRAQQIGEVVADFRAAASPGRRDGVREPVRVASGGVSERRLMGGKETQGDS